MHNGIYQCHGNILNMVMYHLLAVKQNLYYIKACLLTKLIEKECITKSEEWAISRKGARQKELHDGAQEQESRHHLKK